MQKAAWIRAAFCIKNFIVINHLSRYNFILIKSFFKCILRAMDVLLTTKEAANKLGITSVRVNQLIKAGILPAEKHGRDYLIQESDVEKAKDRPDRRGRPCQSNPLKASKGKRKQPEKVQIK
jgi:excisionase family DNA binding protein